MPHIYSILGCGRQGAAAAYDLILRGDASEIRLIDADMGSATRTAERLLRLLGPPPVTSRPGHGPRAAGRPPLGYRLVFNVADLTSEYTGEAVCLRAGKVVELAALTELEEVEFPMPVGKCEAFLTSGGASTAPWTFAGRLETYEHKTVRYKGHFDRVRCLVDLGFLDTERHDVNGGSIAPRAPTHLLPDKELRH